MPRRPAGIADGAATTRDAPRSAAARVSATAFWITALALAVLALLVFFVLPRWVERSEDRPKPPTATAMPAPSAATAASPAPASGPAKPAWDDPDLLVARAAAQGARAQYQEQSARLQSHGVSRWGADDLEKATQPAAAGEAAFAAQDFSAARSAYETAAAGTAALLAQVPQRLATALEDGGRALDAGDKAAAQAAFERARLIEPGNAAAARGLQRVASLDAVRAELDSARHLEQAGDPAGARTALQRALALDPDTRSARAALARLDADARDADFRRTMGEAIGAIERGHYDLADKRLAQARTLRPGDPALQPAISRLAEARRNQRLAGLQQEAAAQVAAGDWAGAIATYRKALQLDPNVAFARDGLVHAEPRAALAQRLQDFVDRPERLSSPAVASEAAQAAADARALAAPGTRLGAQLAALERALAAAATPVPVQLRSDGKTEVTVYRVGTLGKFTTHSLALKPGRYVAIGARTGYRDVRQEFEVAAGAQVPAIEVRCEEPL